jgi:hypothetical protein
VAVGDERAHAARLGEGQRLAVMGLADLGHRGDRVRLGGTPAAGGREQGALQKYS